MIESFSKYYYEVADKCKKFLETIDNIQFNKKEESYKIFLLTIIKVNIKNAESITLLLNNNQISSSLMICRNIIESFFNIDWGFEPEDDDKVKERFYKLEADYLYHIEKQIELIIKDQSTPKPKWDKKIVEELKNMLDMYRKNYPYLLTTNKKGKTVFKRLPTFADRMADKRLQYYQFYIFTSLFSHPSPKLNDYFIDKFNLGNIDNALKQTLALCIYLIQSIIGYAEIIFKDTNSNFNTRKQCYEEIIEIVKNASKGIVNFNV
ncbi:MAG: DUF5677 domain-containing protein [Ignavibacteriaceae bacterium]|nr:DUF5677 domain-containing protein [Ignavibacteriaceae bacterium]